MLRCWFALVLAPALFAQSDVPHKLVARAESSTAMIDDLREL